MIPRQPEATTYQPRRRGLMIAVLVMVAGYLLASGLATLWTDYLWFNSVGYSVVWRTQLLVGGGLATGATLVAFLLLWANLGIADSLAPRFELLELGEDEEIVQRFHQWVEPRLRRVRLLAAAALALFLGLGAAMWRNDFLLMLNPRSFGIADPLFGEDVGFYLFTLPFLSELVSWMFNVFGLTFLMTLAVHYLNGGIRLRRGAGLLVTPKVKTHLSVLAALVALVRAVGYRIDMYELVYSTRGAAFGAGYTDVNARLPAIQLLLLISILAAVLFVANIFRRGWTLAIVSVGAWLVVSVVVGQIFPAIFQRLQVEPSRLARETPFIERNLGFTKAAYGLGEVGVVGFTASLDLDAADLRTNSETIENLRLWHQAVISRNYRSRQGLAPYYRLDHVDVDRYPLSGELTQVMVAVRELDEQNLPASDWLSTRLLYTHGFGVVMSPANSVVGLQGQPDFLVKDVPPVTTVPELALDQARIYFGEASQGASPVIVGTGETPQEVDAPISGTENEATSQSRYDGKAGVGIGSFFRRLAFALRYRDLNLLLSGQLKPDSRVLMERNVRSMVEKAAPFLMVDSDPYPVIVDGRVVWVVDLYTASSRYPYSTPIGPEDRNRLKASSELREGVNYLRNSVKATIDAYDGTMTFYIVDPADPLVASYAAAYPNLFVDRGVLGPELRSHLRYPVDLFTVQSERYLLYHMESPQEFFQRSDAWEVPEDPSGNLRIEPLVGDRLSSDGRIAYFDQMLPYYLLMELPGEERLSYVLLQPFNPRGKRNMASFLVAESEPEQYGLGRLIEFQMPRGATVEGPGVVADRIQQDGDISSQISLWNQRGSEVVLGDMLVVPIEQSLIYIQPVHLAAERGGLPEFQRAIVVFGEKIEWRESLAEALSAVFGAQVGGGEPTEGDVAELLAAAAQAFAAADQALRAGDLAEYQRLIGEARDLVQQAQEVLGATEASSSTFS